MENFLVHYATYSWQNLILDINSDGAFLKLITFLFGVTLFSYLIFCCTRNKRKLSKITQTELILPSVDVSDNVKSESNDFLLNYIFNHKLCFSHVISCWIANFNDFQHSNIISKKCQINKMAKEINLEFKCSDLKIVENKEIFSFTFRLNCCKLIFDVVLKYNSNIKQLGTIVITNLELMVLVIIRVSAQGLLLKFCPESVCGINCELNIDGISVSEKEMSVTEFKRDFKLVLLQTIEMDWGGQIRPCASEEEICRVNQSCQVDLLDFESNNSNPITNSDGSVSVETSDFIEAHQFNEVNEEETPKNKTMEYDFEKHRAQKLNSQASLFTTESFDYYEHGEESPFHDRFTSKLIGRTLVVGLVKIIETSELKIPLKKGYCVLELDEPYQRHVSHLISLGEYPVWNQHFIFSMNSNSQRISVELFQASKKGQSPISLGISLIPISLIIIGQSGNSFPININHFGSRTSWRCDNIAGAPDSKIPAFVIEFQIMKNVEGQIKPGVEPSSERSSGSGIFVTNEPPVKMIDSNDASIESGNKMQTIPESQTSSTGNTLISFDNSKVLLRHKPGEEHRSKSMIRKLRNRFSQLSAPWTTQKSKSDDCLDQMSNEDISKPDPNYIVPVQPPAELFMTSAKSKFFSKNPETDLINSRGLSSSLKKMLSFPTKKSSKTDQFIDKSLEHLFKEMDPKRFDSISKEGFDRIMHDDYAD